MSIGELSEIMTAMSAVGAVIIGLINSRKITEIHISTNSKMDALLNLTKTSATAEGVIQGREQAAAEATKSAPEA